MFFKFFFRVNIRVILWYISKQVSFLWFQFQVECRSCFSICLICIFLPKRTICQRWLLSLIHQGTFNINIWWSRKLHISTQRFLGHLQNVPLTHPTPISYITRQQQQRVLPLVHLHHNKEEGCNCLLQHFSTFYRTDIFKTGKSDQFEILYCSFCRFFLFSN